MDLAALLDTLQGFLASEGAQTRRDLLLLAEKVGSIQGQLDQTSYRLTDLHSGFLDLGRRMDEGFAAERRDREQGLARLEERMDAGYARVDRLVQSVAPRHEQDALTARVDQGEEEIHALKRHLPGEAA